jgi:mono/diheme cytochrome c family protein
MNDGRTAMATAHRVHRLVLAAILVLTASMASAAEVPNAAAGRRVAIRWCASCHLIGGKQAGATTEAPPFATIAARPDFDAGKLAFFLRDPHPKMPNMQLSRLEAANLAEYIKSLK